MQSSQPVHSVASVKADVGPFLPQRFAPPDYAILNAARGYKQNTILEMGTALYGPSGEPLDAEAEPTAGQALGDYEKNSEGSALWRAKRQEFGLSAEPQTDPAVAGQVKEDPKKESSQPHQREQRGDEWSEQAARSSDWATSWQREWETSEETNTGGSWWEAPGNEWSQLARAYEDVWSSQPTWSSNAPAWTNEENGPAGPRGLPVVRLWGSGERRQLVSSQPLFA